ncbi:hypothetical protein, partial [Sunxiuqinia rutila]|uniref:hypothetical protein n=1 Tax=Sunxiuqinia rutila TaxID=1397841 RepID=UPI003D36D59C
MVLKNKILSVVVGVVVLACFLQEISFSQAHPSSESFQKNSLDVFFMAEREIAASADQQLVNAPASELIALVPEKKNESPNELLNTGAERPAIPSSMTAQAGLTITSTATGGPWNETASWDGGVVPDADDDVTILAGATITTDNVLINASLTLGNGANLEVTGDWTNNGTFDAGTNSTVSFTGSTDGTISGTSTTVFKHFILNKDAANTLQVNAPIVLSGTITLTSGKLLVNPSGSINCTYNTGFTIEVDAGLLVQGGSLTTGAFSIENKGIFQVEENSTVSLGSDPGNSLTIRSEGILNINGGTVDIAGRLVVSGGTANIFGGTITLAKVGHSSTTFATLHLTKEANFEMTGGTIIFHQPNGSGYWDVSIIDGTSGSKSMTGGTLQFGTATTSGTFSINSPIPFYNITVSENTTLELVANDLVINKQLYMKDGSNIDAATNSLTVILNDSDVGALVSSNGYVLGTLQRAIAVTDVAGYRFPVNHSVLKLNFTNITQNGYISVTSAAGSHPNIGSSLLNSGASMNSYWTIENSGVEFESLGGSFEFEANLAGDYLVGMFDGNWSYPATTRTAKIVNFSGINSLSTTTSFALAECVPPTITLGDSPEVCEGTTTTNLPYIATAGAPDTYRIDFDATAESEGFKDIGVPSLPADEISIIIPGGVSPGTYNASLYVSNATDCESSGVDFTIDVYDNPDMVLQNLEDCEDGTTG